MTFLYRIYKTWLNHLTNARDTLQSHSFEMIEQMSNCINNTDTASVSMDYSRNVMKEEEGIQASEI